MIRTADNQQLPQRASGKTAYFVLFALVMLQLGVALHHDQHSATELTGTCVACVQLEQFDDLVAPTGTQFATVSQDPDGSIATATTPASRFVRPYDGRAPPSLS